MSDLGQFADSPEGPRLRYERTDWRSYREAHRGKDFGR